MYISMNTPLLCKAFAADYKIRTEFVRFHPTTQISCLMFPSFVSIPLFPWDVDVKNENVQQAWVCYIFSAFLCPLLMQKPLILLSLLVHIAPLVSGLSITISPNVNSAGTITIDWTVASRGPYVNHPISLSHSVPATLFRLSSVTRHSTPTLPSPTMLSRRPWVLP